MNSTPAAIPERCLQGYFTSFKLDKNKMKSILTILLFAFSLTLISCKQTSKNETIIPADWIKLSLPNSWILYAPKTFYAKALQGIDTEPGVINSNQDSIYLQFDCGTAQLKSKDCSFKSEMKEAENAIETGFYKEFYKIPSEHTAYIDTIDNKVAIFIKPNVSGQGTFGINITDCETSEWLEITGKNLSPEKEKLVLAIFKTIKLTQKK
jgi:hypothetical protein